jgi:phage shock protein C
VERSGLRPRENFVEGRAVVNNRLYRSRTDRMVAGVCGGLGEYFGIDSTLVRLFFVVAAILTGGLMILIYLVMMLVIPGEPFGLAKPTPAESMDEPSTPTPSEPPPGIDEPPQFSFGSGSIAGSSRFSSTPTTYDQIGRRRQLVGWGLVALGTLVLMANLNLLGWLNLHVTWPGFLILAGVLLLLRQHYQRY